MMNDNATLLTTGTQDDNSSSLSLLIKWFDNCHELSLHNNGVVMRGKRSARFLKWLTTGYDKNGRESFIRHITLVNPVKLTPFTQALTALDNNFTLTRSDSDNTIHYLDSDGGDASKYVYMYAMQVIRLALTSAGSSWMLALGVPRCILLSFIEPTLRVDNDEAISALKPFYADDDYMDAMRFIDNLSHASVIKSWNNMQWFLQTGLKMSLGELDVMRIIMISKCKNDADANEVADYIQHWKPSDKILSIMSNTYNNNDVDPFSYIARYPAIEQMHIMSAEPDYNAFMQAYDSIQRMLALWHEGAIITYTHAVDVGIINNVLMRAVEDYSYDTAAALMIIIDTISGIINSDPVSIWYNDTTNDNSVLLLQALLALDSTIITQIAEDYPTEFIRESLLAKAVDVKIDTSCMSDPFEDNIAVF